MRSHDGNAFKTPWTRHEHAMNTQQPVSDTPTCSLRILQTQILRTLHTQKTYQEPDLYSENLTETAASYLFTFIVRWGVIKIMKNQEKKKSKNKQTISNDQWGRLRGSDMLKKGAASRHKHTKEQVGTNINNGARGVTLWVGLGRSASGG